MHKKCFLKMKRPAFVFEPKDLLQRFLATLKSEIKEAAGDKEPGHEYLVLIIVLYFARTMSLLGDIPT